MMQRTLLSRRDFLRTSAGLAAVATLAACAPAAAPATGGSESGQAASSEGATIAYWTFWADR